MGYFYCRTMEYQSKGNNMTNKYKCKCYRHPDTTFTVKIVNSKRICPRCGGEIIKNGDNNDQPT